MATQIRIQMCETIDKALKLHKQITGSEFFECYENSKSSTIRCAERNRYSEWLVDLKTGDIYFITECPDRLLVLNRLSLCYCLDDSPFKEVLVTTVSLTILNSNFSRSAESRKKLAAANTVVQ